MTDGGFLQVMKLIGIISEETTGGTLLPIYFWAIPIWNFPAVCKLYFYIVKVHRNGDFRLNKYVRPRNTRRDMYAGHVACCPLVTHIEYMRRALHYG